ncbi:phosphocholine-specific phospholipase C [Variovorax paradoxus]|uniref:phosphocholine-specific phospholipase C n=1 Tax=Variovorax paradoxus TaxID=34073 RepID=UPI0024817281|nr:phospholipase C, phosphocholine-specific [Variovorax paradoxus]WGT62810.1 phospholipase C, phosphocholine-specific [Variovorax paradoxus]
MTTRRKFLQSATGTGIAAATLATFPPSIRRALAIPAHHETGTIKDVKHVVLLMQENRSFDSYFGTFKGVRGYGDRFAVPAPNGKTIFHQTYTKTTPPSTYTPYRLEESKGNAQRAGSTPHSWSDSQAAWDHGRMFKWPDVKNLLSMGYYDTAEVPFQRALAEAFTLCDHYHCGMHTGTIANRLFYWSGTNGPNGTSPADGSKVQLAVLNNQFNAGNDIGASTEGWTWTTYADRLEKAGVKWKVYQSLIDNFGCNEMMSFRHWRTAIEQMPEARRPVYVPATDITQPVTAAGPFYDAAIDDPLSPLAKGFGNTMPYGFLETFKEDIRNGTLPAVSWIISPSAYSEHPGPSSPAKGGWYVQEVLDALTSNPEVWSKTVLLINFDENDGFFDHLPSPAVPSRNPDGSLAGATTMAEADVAVEYHNYTPATPKQPAMDGRPYGPGPRVPMWIVSPWSRGGWVNSQVCDHTSTLMFLEKCFGVAEPQISKHRRAVCSDLTSAFNFERPNDEPLPTLAGRKTKAEADALTTAQEALPKIVPMADADLPVQATGVRPSRALPYELHTSARSDALNGRVQLLFANSGKAAAVFHVYDKLHLADRIPRRYVVEPGKQLDGYWNAMTDNAGLYDLWVLGPNGYHRQFKGDLNRLRAGGAAAPEIRVGYDARRGDIYLQMRNDGRRDCRFTVQSNKAYPRPDAYQAGGRGRHDDRGRDGHGGHGHEGHEDHDNNGVYGTHPDGSWRIRVKGGGDTAMRWSLDASGQWYDFVVTCDADPSFYRRFAGRIETGRHSVSDPAMGLADRF